MDAALKDEFEKFMSGVRWRNPNEAEFHQAVGEVAESIIPYIADHQKYRDANILDRMTEPDRVISFRVCWEDDAGNIRTNRGYRVQFNNAIGPYKGGLRFDKSVNISILKFLGFEQVFKNSLTTLPLGGGKGGANFNPKGKSDREVMRFCQSFMTELSRHIGKDRDIPAGDIGVGAREVSYLFGQYKRLSVEFTGILTGKGLSYGGSLIRTEATGYGSVYFAKEMLLNKGEDIKGKTATVSGSGNVAIYTAEKLIDLGATVLSLSDSGGTVYDPKGIDKDKLKYIKDLKTVRHGRIKEYAEKYGCEFYEGKRPWSIKCDMAFPSATQNELDGDDARELIKNGCMLVSEGANMPSTLEAIKIFIDNKILYGPAKAANAGGVAVSGLEMTQNSMRLSWDREELDERLKKIMGKIHKQCITHGTDEATKVVNYVQGANVAGFIKVADAMLTYGCV